MIDESVSSGTDGLTENEARGNDKSTIERGGVGSGLSIKTWSETIYRQEVKERRVKDAPQVDSSMQRDNIPERMGMVSSSLLAWTISRRLKPPNLGNHTRQRVLGYLLTGWKEGQWATSPKTWRQDGSSSYTEGIRPWTLNSMGQLGAAQIDSGEKNERKWSKLDRRKDSETKIQIQICKDTKEIKKVTNEAEEALVFCLLL